MDREYLGQIENRNGKVMVYYTKDGYYLSIYRNDILMHECDLLDDDHVWRELRAMGYPKYFCKAILKML